jgi:hypothetical protein
MGQYVVNVASSRGVIRLSSCDLSGGDREQLRANIRGAVEKHIFERLSALDESLLDGVEIAAR